jgi:hypothetical protein
MYIFGEYNESLMVRASHHFKALSCGLVSLDRIIGHHVARGLVIKNAGRKASEEMRKTTLKNYNESLNI